MDKLSLSNPAITPKVRQMIFQKMKTVAVYRMCDTNHSVRKEMCQFREKDIECMADVCEELRNIAHNYPELKHMTSTEIASQIKAIWDSDTILHVINNDNVFYVLYDYSSALKKCLICLTYLGKDKI